MKICILIISSTLNNNEKNREIMYPKLKNIWKQYMTDNCYFIEYDNNLTTNFIINKNTIKIKGNESYKPGIFNKTIKALELLYFQYDYFIRTNLSTFINLNKIEKIFKNHLDIGCGTPYATKDCPHGATLLMSKKFVFNLIKNESLCKFKYNFIDDQTIGKIALKLNYNPIIIPNIFYQENIKNYDNIDNDNIIFYRIRDNNINKYVYLLKKIYKIYYKCIMD
jgi:hypothetical protein